MPKPKKHAHAQEALAAAIEFHQRGELEAAAARYKSALNADRHNTDALHLYGILNHQCGRHAQAIKWIKKAIAQNPRVPAFYSNLGEAHRGAGHDKAAQDCYRKALELDPNFTDALINLGSVLRQRGQTEAAIASYERALELDPASVHGWFNIAGAYMDATNWPAAAVAFGKVVDFAPDAADAHLGLGMALKEMEDYEAAADALEAALKIDPNRGDVVNNLGNIHMVLGHFTRAKACLERALAVSPDDISILCNWADMHVAMGEVSTARETYLRVLALEPDSVMANTGIANAAFFAGEWKAAWAGYQFRFRSKDFEKRPFPYPEWNGEDIGGRKILVWGEQGIGEEIQFASMIPDLVATGAKVTLESDPRLVSLFRRAWPALAVVPRTAPADPATADQDIAYQCASGSLGRVFRQHDADFGQGHSFLEADQTLTQDLRRRYRAGGDPILVGVAWHSKKPVMGRLKSMALHALIPIFKARDDVRFVDLQYGDTAEDRESLTRESGVGIFHDDDVDQMTDLDTFAAQVAAMDLVITISNTTAHVAGALGVPTWVMLSSAPLNRWMMNRDDSPWYGSVKLFRQSTLGNWSDVVEAVAAELARHNPLAN